MDLIIKEGRIPINKDKFVVLGSTVIASLGRRNVFSAGNGTGKTTLFRWLAGQLESEADISTQPKLEVNGRRSKPPLSNIAAFVPQSASDCLFGLPVYEELQATFGILDHDFLSKLIDWLELTPFLDRLSFELSDGERMRVAIATALAMRRDWLILDEWGSHLDPTWHDTIQALLKERATQINRGVVEFISDPRITKEHSQPIDLSTNQLQMDYNGFRKDLEDAFGGAVINHRAFSIRHSGKLRNGLFRKNLGVVTFQSSSISAIVGRNGTGKTTFLKSLFKDSYAKAYRRNICLVLPDPGIQLKVDKLNRLLGQFSVSDVVSSRVSKFFFGMDECTNSWNLNYSKRKLLAVMLGTLTTKKILVIDEAFSGLDQHSRIIMKDSINFAANNLGKCIIITSPSNSVISDIELGQVVNLG